MTVLVTGATGFLGSNLAVKLQSAGCLATGRNEALLAKLGDRGIRTLPLNLASAVPSQGALGTIEAIVHCAGLSSPWGRPAEFVSCNVDATRNLIELARRLKVKRFVYVSTASVYFRFADQDQLMESASLPRPVNDYALTKRLAEKLVLEASDIGPVVLRPRGIYGAGDTALLPRLLRVARRRAIPIFKESGATDITHVDDVVEACKAALVSGPTSVGEVINVSGGNGIMLRQIIEAACTATGVTPRFRKLPFSTTLAAVRSMERVAKALPHRPEPPVTAYSLGILRYRQTLDISKARHLLNWTPGIDFQEGLRRTFEGGTMREGVL